MADEMIMTPVKGADPCGEDLRWDMEFMTVMQEFDTVFLGDEEGVVAGASATGDAPPDADDYIARVNRLCARTKDVRLLAVRAEALWRSGGLADFGGAMEDLTAVAELWADPAAGIHPRADEFDGDLGERAAPLVKLLNVAPVLARTVGWGREPAPDRRQAVADALKGVFDSWTARLEPAFGDDLPSRNDAWQAIQPLLSGTEALAPDGGDAAGAETVGAVGMAAPPPADAWDLVQRAGELMATQDRHSPALPLLELLLIWRSKGILEIAEGMKMSGLTMEQLLDSIRKQIASN